MAAAYISIRTYSLNCWKTAQQDQVLVLPSMANYSSKGFLTCLILIACHVEVQELRAFFFFFVVVVIVVVVVVVVFFFFLFFVDF